MRTTVQILDFIPNQNRAMEEFLLSLTKRLNGQGWRVIFVFCGEPSNEFRSRLLALNTRYTLARFPLGARGAYHLSLWLRQFKPDAIQTHFLSPFTIGLPILKFLCRARWLIVTNHSSRAASRKGLVKKLVARLRGAAAGSYIDHIVVVSDFVRQRSVAAVYLPESKIRIIHNGIDLERFSPGPTENKNASASLEVVYVGRLLPQKGVHYLLQAAEQLTKICAVPFKVRIAGRGTQANELRDYCKERNLDQVEFLGQIDWVPKLLSSADVVVVPSYEDEAFGYVVAEAMGCQACVLASDAGGIPEVIGPSGEAGMIFRRGDVGDLKNKLKLLLESRSTRDALKIKARLRAVGNFSLERMVGQYVLLYNELH